METQTSESEPGVIQMSGSRGRILSVRVTKEQYDALERMLQTERARSVSEVARKLITNAMQRAHPSPPTVQEHIARLDRILLKIHKNIKIILDRPPHHNTD
jgi:Arc/MetJ-type ribon-helix-helix transcriptional regulator